jgi:hypothetical protein
MPYEVASKMNPVPLSKESVMPLAIAVPVPMVGVGTTRLPSEELFAFAFKLPF